MIWGYGTLVQVIAYCQMTPNHCLMQCCLSSNHKRQSNLVYIGSGNGLVLCLLLDLMAPTWWRQQMETLSALLALCAGNSLVTGERCDMAFIEPMHRNKPNITYLLVTGEFPSQRPVTRSYDVFFDLHLNTWLNKQSRHWWFGMPSCSLWQHCNESIKSQHCSSIMWGNESWHIAFPAGIHVSIWLTTRGMTK